MSMGQLGGSGGIQVTCEAQGMALSLPGACPHCSSPYSATFHNGPCPRIKAIEYHPNGSVKRIEFKEPS